MSQDEFPMLFERFKSILQPYVARLQVSDDRPGSYAVDTAPEGERSPATYFGGARIGKRYVSYYLMPLYSDPSLGDDLSPGLRKRRQGKSCFNLSTIDEPLLDELARLTARGFERTAGDPTWRPPATTRPG